MKAPVSWLVFLSAVYINNGIAEINSTNNGVNPMAIVLQDAPPQGNVVSGHDVSAMEAAKV